MTTPPSLPPRALASFCRLPAALLGLIAVSVAAVPAATAQAPGDPAPTPTSAPPPASGDDDDAMLRQRIAESEIPLGVFEDANSGRAFAAPTALTNPAGTWSFSSTELLLLGLGYSFTDRFSASVTTLAPITSDIPLVLLGAAKLKLVEAGGWHLAGHFTVAHLAEEGDGGTAALVGGTLTRCLDRDCYSNISGYLGAGVALDEAQSTVPFVASLSAAGRVSKRVKLLVEADFGFTAGEFSEVSDGFLLGYGARITSRQFGVDLGFVRPICLSCDDNDEFLLGIPWVGFTYRAI